MPRPRTSLLGFATFAAITLLCAGANGAESGRPLIRSFGASEIHAQGPVLSFAETADGSLFIGSNRLVLFDGLASQRIDIPGAYAFRALASDRSSATGNAKPRVWVGGIGALGYAERDARGVWNFVSLASEVLSAHLPMPGEVWFVSPAGSGAIFVGAHSVLRWDGRRFQGWTFAADSRLTACSDESGTVWLDQSGTGLLRLGVEGDPAMARMESSMPSGLVRWMLKPQGTARTGADGTGLLMGTDSGVYRLSGGLAQRIDALSALVSGLSSVQAASTDRGELAIGTLRQGVVLASEDGIQRTNVDHASGLADDTVYAIWNDRRGGIWVGLANGCCRLDSVGIVSIFDAREGLEEGLPRKVVTHSGIRYVLTDRRLYRIADGTATGQLIAVFTSSSQLNDALDTPDGILVGGIDGLWGINPSTGESHKYRPANIEKIAAAPWAPQGVIYTSNYSLKALVKEGPDDWASIDLGVTFSDAPVSLLVDRSEVWLSTAAGGIFRYRLKAGSPHLLLEPAGHYPSSLAASDTPIRVVLSEVGPRLVAFTPTQVLEFNEHSGFQAMPGISEWTVTGAAEMKMPGEGTRDPTAYWLAQSTRLTDSPPFNLIRAHLDTEAGAIRWEVLREGGLDSLGDITSFDETEGPNGPLGWVGGKGGLLRIELEQLHSAGPTRDLQLREVRTDREGLLPLSPLRQVRIGPGPRRIEFGFSAAQPMETNPFGVYYQTRLVGFETDWSAPERKNVWEFTGLAPGAYVFQAHRMDRQGRSGETVSYPFVVIAPWFERWPAILCYCAALLLIVALFLRWRVRNLELQTARLDRLVAQRTRELELSNTAKNEFLENISHEIRNPLNGIIGLARLLKPEHMDKADREVAHSLRESAERLRRVSEDVLGVSKLEFGQVSVDERPFSLRRALQDVVELHAEAARQQGNMIELSLPAHSDDRFIADESKIKTIIGNFLGNAIKYAPGSPLSVRADLAKEPDGTLQAFIDVVDRGPGIPPEEQELIFQKFVRGSNARSGTIGSGIGLAMCRTLASHMRGAVGVDSPAPTQDGSPARGSAFHLWIPLKPAPTIEAPPSESGKALIVDDEEFNRLVLAGLLKELGYQPLLAANASDALDLAQRDGFVLVFLDLELPGEKGDETARRLRKLPRGDQMIVIATTGQDGEEARRRCREAGMDGFLLKPFDVSQVRDAIAQAQGRSLGEKTSPATPLSAPSQRAFELYARGSNESLEVARKRFRDALDHEWSSLSQALEKNDRTGVRAAGHRLRTLAALVKAEHLNSLAAKLQDSEPIGLGQVTEWVNEAGVEVTRLKAGLAAHD